MSDKVKGILALSLMTIVFYVIGFYCLLRPNLVRTITLKNSSRRYNWPFYNMREKIINTNGYLLYLRFFGVLLILFASLFVYLIVHTLAPTRT